MSLPQRCPIPHPPLICHWSKQTDFVVYLLQFVGIAYLDRSVTLAAAETLHKSFAGRFGYDLIVISQLRPGFGYGRN